jgi:hypothetical protein
VRTVALNAAVAAAYVMLGVLVPQLLFSWVEGVAFYLVGVWVVPTLVRRLR